MMKKLIINLAILMLLCSITQNALASTPYNQEKGKITAQASEFAYIAPDTATINLTITTTDKNSQKAVELNNDKIENLITTIKKNLAENETIKTSNYRLNPTYEYNNFSKKNVLTGYNVTNTITITLKNTNKVGKIISIATKNDATTINGLSFSVVNTDDTCKDLTAKAVLKAKKEAENVLAPLGKTIDSIANISYGCSTQMNYSPYRSFGLMKNASSDSVTEEAISVEPGETKVQASVTIVFTIK